MYPLGHIGITVFLSVLLYLPASFAFIGVLLPDVIDKLLFAAGLVPCSIFFSHTVFFGPIISILTFLVTKRKDISLAILLGSFAHLLEDANHFVPWLYPIINYPFNCGPLTFTITPFVVLTEALGVALLVATVVFNSKLIYFRDKINSWLKVLTN